MTLQKRGQWSVEHVIAQSTNKRSEVNESATTQGGKLSPPESAQPSLVAEWFAPSELVHGHKMVSSKSFRGLKHICDRPQVVAIPLNCFVHRETEKNIPNVTAQCQCMVSFEHRHIARLVLRWDQP